MTNRQHAKSLHHVMQAQGASEAHATAGMSANMGAEIKTMIHVPQLPHTVRIQRAPGVTGQASLMHLSKLYKLQLSKVAKSAVD